MELLIFLIYILRGTMLATIGSFIAFSMLCASV
jgi:hypothetical protein